MGKNKKSTRKAEATGDPGDPTPAQEKEHAKRQKVAAERMAKVQAEKEGRKAEPYTDAAATDTEHTGKTGHDKAREFKRPKSEVHPNPDPEPGDENAGGGVGPAVDKGTKTKRHARK